MPYVYILKSIKDSNQIYIGLTQEIKQRLNEHNGGQSIYTNKYKPWQLESYIWFSIALFITNRRKGNIWSSFFMTGTKTDLFSFRSISLEKTNNNELSHAFERYLKRGSGHAFLKKHFII